jgi:hypothetical protein
MAKGKIGDPAGRPLSLKKNIGEGVLEVIG